MGTLLFCVAKSGSPDQNNSRLRSGVILALASSARVFRELRAASVTSNLRFVPALIVIFVLLISAIGGLAEPVGDIRMDEIAYHLLGPKVWLRNTVIRPVTDEAYTAFPAVVEVQYAALSRSLANVAPDFSRPSSYSPSSLSRRASLYVQALDRRAPGGRPR